MRRNSGRDEGRNRRLDPTIKEHERELGKSGSAILGRRPGDGETRDNRGQRTTEMGSDIRKDGQKGG